nr:uncharacterized protein LOC109175354 [Ipomoea trifida]
MEKQKASFMVALLVILLCSSSSLTSCSNPEEVESLVELELKGTTTTTLTTPTISDVRQVDTCRTKKCNITCDTNAQCQTKNCPSSCPSCNKVGFPNEQKRCGPRPNDVGLLELPVTRQENALVI